MKGLKWVLIGLGVTVVLSGCSGFWNALPTTTTGTGGTASGVFYVANQTTSQIVGFSFATGSTTPTAVTGSPYGLSAEPFSMAMPPSGSLLYVSTAAGIYLYDVGTGGALTLANNSQVISADPAYTMQIDPSGQWLVEAVSGAGTISAIPLDTTTGGVSTTLTVQTANLSATTVQQLAIAPNGGFVYVALGTGGTEEIPFNAANTNPFGSSGQVVKPANPSSSTAASALSVAVDPTSRLVYIGETLATTGSQTGGLRVFPLTTSGLGTEVTGSPYATGGTGPSAILPDPTGSYVYAANKAVSGQTTSLVDAYSIQATTSVYSLTSLGTIATGTTPSGIAEDSTKTYLLVVNSGGSPDLNAYTFDTTTPGMLVSFVTATTGTDPVGAISIVGVP